MSLVTICPACSTKFYVSENHLTSYNGLVKCGQCTRVFNALEQLNQISAHSEEMTQNGITNNKIISDNTKETFTLAAHERIDESTPEDIQSENSSHKKSDDLQSSEPQNHHALATDKNQTHEDIVDDLGEPPITEHIEISHSTYTDNFSEESLASLKEKISVPDVDDKIPAFLNDVTSHKQIEKSPRHSLYLMLIGILFITATLQTIYFLRTGISSNFPALKPYLAQACELLDCKIELPKNLELLVIDDSDMQEDEQHEGLVHLKCTLVNHAAYAQEYPLLELTLTDADNKPVIRRSFKPQEYLESDTDIASGMLGGDELHPNLAIQIKDEKVSGYRLYVNYAR